VDFRNTWPLCARSAGAPDIGKFTLGACQSETVKALLDAERARPIANRPQLDKLPHGAP
jgi:hypothetical protein